LSACIVGLFVRDRLGFAFSPESIQAWVDNLGWKGPMIFLVIAIFRQFLFIPIAILLIAGGLCFGVLAGTVLGTVGIFGSALINFSFARYIHQNWTQKWIGQKVEKIEQNIGSLKSYLVGIFTAYPVLPITPIHLAAGLSSISLMSFMIAVVLGGLVRAGTYSFLGFTLLDFGSPRFYLGLVLLLILALIPLFFPSLRRRLFIGGQSSRDASKNN